MQHIEIDKSTGLNDTLVVDEKIDWLRAVG